MPIVIEPSNRYMVSEVVNEKNNLREIEFQIKTEVRNIARGTMQTYERTRASVSNPPAQL